MPDALVERFGDFDRAAAENLVHFAGLRGELDEPGVRRGRRGNQHGVDVLQRVLGVLGHAASEALPQRRRRGRHGIEDRRELGAGRLGEVVGVHGPDTAAA